MQVKCIRSMTAIGLGLGLASLSSSAIAQGEPKISFPTATSRQLTFPTWDKYVFASGLSDLSQINVSLIEEMLAVDPKQIRTHIIVNYSIYNRSHNSAPAGKNGADNTIHIDFTDAAGNIIQADAYTFPMGRSTCRYRPDEKLLHYEGRIPNNFFDVVKGYKIRVSGGSGRIGPC